MGQKGEVQILPCGGEGTGPRRVAAWSGLVSGVHGHHLPNLRTWEEIGNPKEGEMRDLKGGTDQGK